jgi:putative membrane protein
MMDGWDMTGWGWAWMSLMMGVGILLVVVLAVLVLRGSPGPGSRERDDPLDILRRRLARGEIDEAEYRRRRDVLEPPG